MSKFGWSYPAGCSGPPDDDLPEECPVCGEPNWDEDTEEPLFADDPSFCSKGCREEYSEAMAEQALLEERAIRAMEEQALKLLSLP